VTPAVLLRRFIADENGGTLVEYALVMALLSMSALGVLAAFGQSATDSLDASATALKYSSEHVPGDPP
jgi:Flp pilus assembly pilin Flp